MHGNVSIVSVNLYKYEYMSCMCTLNPHACSVQTTQMSAMPACVGMHVPMHNMHMLAISAHVG